MNEGTNTYDLSLDYGIGYDNQGRKFYFDKDDYEKIKDFYWRVHSHKYVSTRMFNYDVGKKTQVQLHRFIMNPLPNQEVNHINHDPFDNRKSNLRIVSTSQNQMNTIISVRNTSGVKGVNWDITSNKWRARICIDGKRISLGCFDSIELASKAREEAEKKYYGEYRYNSV